MLISLIINLFTRNPARSPPRRSPLSPLRKKDVSAPLYLRPQRLSHHPQLARDICSPAILLHNMFHNSKKSLNTEPTGTLSANSNRQLEWKILSGPSHWGGKEKKKKKSKSTSKE